MKLWTLEEFEALMTRLDAIEGKVINIQKSPEEVFFDNQEFLQVMNISKRTAQTWRDEGLIAFAQVGNKMYYKYSDILELINSNYRPVKKKL